MDVGKVRGRKSTPLPASQSRGYRSFVPVSSILQLLEYWNRIAEPLTVEQVAGVSCLNLDQSDSKIEGRLNDRKEKLLETRRLRGEQGTSYKMQ
ncbi:hypothetical protein E2C01_054238 [Portunus trituberculatus]|uniref:Uncharacterized protein n=1 Tax=Portunus trituberculatus TaxID=210409 RepID=A0A5B7GIS7_PORTR|nr:hypothetical protein [Portunus trituberculatus]